ncbi:MAG: Gfo/Idh/MocA family oxidoreductase [Planctomycetaceae bacterium]
METINWTSTIAACFLKSAGTTIAGIALTRLMSSPPKQRTRRLHRADRCRHAHASKLSVYRDSPDYEVVGIVEPDEQLRRSAETQAAFRDLPWLTQEQLLNVPGLQAVLVETRVKDSLDVAEACVAAGMHIGLDKPAGESLPQFRRILARAEQQNLLVQMGYMYRYNPAIVLLREFLRHGWLGDVFEVHTVMSKVVGSESRIELAEYPGGIMFELGCHILDLVVGVLGKPTEVTSFNQHVSSADDGLVDNMLAVLSYPNAIATVKSSAVEVEGFARRHFVVCSTEGIPHSAAGRSFGAHRSVTAARRLQGRLSGRPISEVHPLRRRRRGHGANHPR